MKSTAKPQGIFLRCENKKKLVSYHYEIQVFYGSFCGDLSFVGRRKTERGDYLRR